MPSPLMSRQIPDEVITDWRTDPDLCRGLAFLSAHADVLMHRLLSASF